LDHHNTLTMDVFVPVPKDQIERAVNALVKHIENIKKRQMQRLFLKMRYLFLFSLL